MSKIKERPECRKKINDILKNAGAVTFEEKYYYLRRLYSDNLDESDKPIKERKYNNNMVKQIEKMFDELQHVYAFIESDIIRRKIKRKCADCGKKHMVNMTDQYRYIHGEKVRFLCSSCRPLRKF